jgi:hypothetical protein
MRNIIRFCPALSPTKQIQPFGRIIRTVEWRYIEALVEAINAAGTHTNMDERALLEMILKTSENTFLIEPNNREISR